MIVTGNNHAAIRAIILMKYGHDYFCSVYFTSLVLCRNYYYYVVTVIIVLPITDLLCNTDISHFFRLFYIKAVVCIFRD